jgi:1-acyl-sn-glycerol-3-phosphate acyltransferase
MVFGEPIYFTGDSTDQGVLRVATNQLMEKIAQLSKQEYVSDTYASDAKDAIKKIFKDRTEFDEDDA